MIRDFAFILTSIILSVTALIGPFNGLMVPVLLTWFIAAGMILHRQTHPERTPS